jgi:hypothetical protein
MLQGASERADALWFTSAPERLPTRKNVVAGKMRFKSAFHQIGFTKALNDPAAFLFQMRLSLLGSIEHGQLQGVGDVQNPLELSAA